MKEKRYLEIKVLIPSFKNAVKPYYEIKIMLIILSTILCILLVITGTKNLKKFTSGGLLRRTCQVGKYEHTNLWI